MSDKSFAIRRIISSDLWVRMVFSLLSCILIIISIEIPIKKHKLEMFEGQILHHERYATYLADDLDNDGNTERIYIYNSPEADLLTIMLYDHKGMIKEIINLPQYDWSYNSIPAIFDIDGDSFRDVLLVTIRRDSVFINAINLNSGEFVIDDFFIDRIQAPGRQLAFGSKFLAFDDYNQDGQKELYFSFDAGFGLKPRGLFRLDVDSMRLYRTPSSYIVWYEPVFKDLNNDGVPELIPCSYAPNNVPYKTDHSDDRAWICAFDLQMNYLFEPIPMPEGHGYVYPSPTHFADNQFFALYSNRSNDSIKNHIFLLDCSGNILNERQIYRDDPTIFSHKISMIGNKTYLLIKNIGQFELTSDLNNLPQYKIEQQNGYKSYFHLVPWKVDINRDGISELFYYNLNLSTVEIRSDSYQLLANLKLPFDRLRIINVFPFLVNGHIDRIMIVTQSGYFFLRYNSNPYYLVKYLIWFSIFIVVYGFIYLIQYFQKRRMEQKWKTEKQLTELQFNTIRNQLNPHFIFNALNSVGYLIENGKKEEAYDYLTVNSRLIRKVLEDSESTIRSLKQEIEFVKDYISIQKFRFNERVNAYFKIDDKVNLNLPVPKMVLHTYVENAYKHAFNNMEAGAELFILISMIAKGVKLIIRDNGERQDNGENTNGSLGKGLSIMESYYRIFEKQYNCSIRFKYVDLNKITKCENGTEVTIWIEY